MNEKTAKAILKIATIRNNVIDNFKKDLEAGNKEEVIETFTKTLDEGCAQAYYHGYYKTAYKTLKWSFFIGTGLYAGYRFYKAYKKITEDTTIEVEIQDDEEQG